MKYLLVSFFAILYEIDASCPNGTFPNVAKDKCYFISKDSRQFILGETSCQNQNGDLASIANAFDNMDLTANAQNLLGSNVTYAWLGGSNVNNGTWIWTDGQPFSYTNWAKGNPDNVTDDSCLALNLSNGHWYSQNCYNIIPYICELSQTNCQNTTCPPCPQTTCPPCQSQCEISCPDSWVYNSKTGFCYKVFYNVTDISYNDGESVCEQYNGYLASIHSDDENSFILGLYTLIYSFIGLHYDLKNNAFQWTDNTPVNYTNFGSNNTSAGYCVGQDPEQGGSWYTGDCSDALGFVCKTRPIWKNNTLEYKIKDTAFLNLVEGNNQIKPKNSYSEQDQCSNTCPTCMPDSCTPCTTPSICNTKCPDGWAYSSATNFCYKIYEPQNLLNFTNAEQTCQQSNGHLISIHNENENNFLKQFITMFNPFWIGLSYNVSLSNFTWTDNTPYDYSYWYSGQPDITSNMYCGVISGEDNFNWGTYSCNASLPFICKKAPNL